MKGTVIRAVGGFFDVYSGKEEVRCRARGVFRKRGTTILVGDEVEYDLLAKGPQGNREGVVSQVYIRKTELIRPPIANCNHAVLVFSLRSPEFHPYLLDRMLVSVELAGLSPTIVLSKSDLLEPEEAVLLSDPYRKAGYEVLIMGRNNRRDLPKLQKRLQDHISVFCGPSGAGKSSLANLLAPQLGLKMGEISEKLGRGRHTTRHVELFRLDGSTFVADAPGFSQLHVNVGSAELRLYFPEFVQLAGECEYRGCLHLDELNCAVKAGLKSGKASSVRYKSYKMLYEELRLKEERRY